ncbi:hypothetical protein [Streptomyces sp. NPDC001508]|uniref:hypothetical protein n=1 Tax=Streptomyces sp. NPDC001508 TaxID=3154656 RepID=UPI00331E4A33
MMMGVYAMMMGGGAATIAALSEPIYRASGNSSSIALGVAVLPAVLALAALATQWGVRPDGNSPGGAVKWTGLLRSGTAWRGG